MSEPAVPLPIAPAPGDDLDPLLALNRDGRAILLWKRHQAEANQTEILIAQSPAWTAVPAASPLDQPPGQIRLALSAGEQVHLAWSQPATRTQIISQRILGDVATTMQVEYPLYQRSALAIGLQGQAHVAWAEPRALRHAYGVDISNTIKITSATLIDTLLLKVDNGGTGHLVWSSRPSGQLGAITYAPLLSGTQPIEIAARGQSPQLEIGPYGRVHLVWSSPQGLYYANSQDWSQVRQLLPKPPKADQFALAIGPGEIAHLAWAAEGALWYANSTDWLHSRARLASVGELSQLRLVIDAVRRPHLAWTAQTEAGDRDLYYLRPLGPAPQIALTFPQGGEMLTHDVMIQAETNLLADDLQRIEFYLQTEAPSRQTQVVTGLGVDTNGRDGWQAPLAVAGLIGARYRVIALGIDEQGQMIRADGGWFTVQNPEAPWVWLGSLDSAPARSTSQVRALVGRSAAPIQWLDLFIAPLTDLSAAQPGRGIEPPGGHPIYLGYYEALQHPEQPLASWQALPFDSQRLPDGYYRPVIVAQDSSDQWGYGLASGSLRVDNALLPQVTLIRPQPGAVIQQAFDIAVDARDPVGKIVRVDFYAERNEILLEGNHQGRAYELEMPQRIWLASDTDGTDGWGLRMRADSHLDGDRWRIWAVALNDRGLTNSARSGQIAIIARQRPYLRILSPSPENALRGMETIRLYAVESPQYLASARAYVQDGDGVLSDLGEMQASAAQWTLNWDTTTLPNGLYSLLIIGQQADGRRSLTRSEMLRIENTVSTYYFKEPAPDATLAGPVGLRIYSASEAIITATVRFYYQDQSGEAHLIGSREGAKEDWALTWDTQTILDGQYELIARITGAEGYTLETRRKVAVRNTTPAITLAQLREGSTWRGSRPITWQAEHPAGRPMTVTAEYSPDDGVHWLELGSGIPSTESLLWDTTAYPDSDQARLRLTVTDGLHYADTVSPRFQVNNVNEPPLVALLAPQTRTSYGGAISFSWQATDPDHDPLTVSIDYRLGSAAWVNLAQNIPNQGSFTWEKSHLPPPGEYDVRITVTDPSGASRDDLMAGIRLVANTPPTVRLLWPHTQVSLKGEAIILWEAADADKDYLAVDLYYSDNAGQTWLPLAEGLPNTGYYVWQVSFLPMGGNYRVRIIVRDGLFQASDQSNGVFAVGSLIRPRLQWASPLADSSLSGQQLISWSTLGADHAALQANLEIRAAGQAEWRPLADKVIDDFYLWNTRAHPDGRYELRLTLHDGQALASTALTRRVTLANNANHPPVVVLASPQGGELWAGLHEVTWQAWDRDGDVLTATLAISADGGKRWQTLATLDGRTGRYLWDTRKARMSRDYMFRIEVSDGRATVEDTSHGVLHLINRYGHPPHVLFTSPDETGQLLRGNTVTWIAEDVDGDPLSISLAISDDNGLTWRELGANIRNSGEYVLSEATLPRAGQSYRLRLWAGDGLYESQVISPPLKRAVVIRPPDLRVDAPAGREQIAGSHTIRWQAIDPLGTKLRLDIEISADGGQSWNTLAKGVENTGSYLWDSTGLANGVYRLRLRADSGQALASRTVGPFTVNNAGGNAPVISIISPRAGSIWAGTQEIRWQATDADGDVLRVNLAYSTDRGVSWCAFAFEVENTGSYIWDTTALPNCDDVRLRATVTDGRFTGQAITADALAIRNLHTPIITLLMPEGGPVQAGKQWVTWVTAYDVDRPVTVTLEISTDMGQSWQPLAQNQSARGSYLWDTSTLREGEQVLLRAVASDHPHQAIDSLLEAITIQGNPRPAYLALDPLW